MFQSLKGILSDLDTESVNLTILGLEVSIPKRDFIGFRRYLWREVVADDAVSIPKRDFIGFRLVNVTITIISLLVSIPKRDFIGFRLYKIFYLEIGQ